MKALSAFPFNTTTCRTPFLGVLVGVAIAATVHGQLLSDDFESYTAGANLDDSGPWTTAQLGGNPVVVRDEATDTPFGTPTQYLDHNDNSTNIIRIQSPNLTAASGAVTTFAFDFNEPSTGGGDNFIFGYSMESSDLTSAGKRIMPNLNDGAIGGLSTSPANTYNLDTPYRLYIVFNDSDSSIDYLGGSLAAGVADVWLQPSGGALTLAGTRTAEKDQTPSYRVGFRGYGSDQQQMLLDNVTLHEGVVVPGAPVLAGTTPADDATFINIATNLVATFDRVVTPGTGSITIKETVGGATVASFDVATDPEVTFDGNTVTIDPASNLALSTEYYVQIDTGAIQNVLGDAFPGITTTTDWSFTTSGDITDPSLLTTTPADDATGVATDVTLVADFDEDVIAGTGNIVITNLTEATTFATIDITDATQVTIAGNTVTIDPASDLHEGRSYAVEIEPGALTDTSNNPFAGIIGTSDWNFATVPDTTNPTLASTAPSDDAATASFTNDLVATFDEAIQIGTGDITILNLPDLSVLATIPVGDARVTVTGSSLMIDPAGNLDPAKQYAVQIDASAITDLSGNPFGGIVAPDVSTWNFTTTTLTSKDSIVGESEINGDPEGYYPNVNSDLVGVGGPGDGREDRNVVLGYTLPTLPVGQFPGSVNFFFEITLARDSTGEENLPSLNVYLLDTDDPVGSGTDFFSHGPPSSALDPLVGTTSVTVSGNQDNEFADDAEDRVFSLTGDALDLLRSMYGDDHIPDQAEVFFGFALDPDPAVNTYRRYRIDLGNHESRVEITPIPPTPPVITDTVPDDNATGIYGGSTLVATFDRNIFAGSGDITIRNLTDNTVFDTIAVTNFQVAFSGPELIITLEFALDSAKEYAIQLDAGVVVDAADNPFGGIVDPDVTTWNFTTATTTVENLSDSDFITGRAESGAQDPGYYTGTSNQVGIGGSSGARYDRNVVLSYTLPTLPVGDSVSAAVLNFEISAYRNHSGADPALNAYLLDSADPSTTGTDFFYHGPNDPNPDVRFVGATDLSEPRGGQVSYGADEQDHEYTISGGALALLRSLYGGDHIPDQTEVYFRFNLDNLIIGGGDAEIGGSTLDRYFLELLDSENRLEIISSPGGGSGGDTFTDWIAGFSVGGMTGLSEDPDGDGSGNGVENFFGTAPDSPSSGLVSGTVSGGAFSFTHPQSATPASDLTAAYVWTTDLATPFNAAGAPDGNGTIVTFTTQADTPSAGVTTVTANVTGTATDKLFVRVEVTQN